MALWLKMLMIHSVLLNSILNNEYQNIITLLNKKLAVKRAAYGE